MKALITGASSGIGREIAKELSKTGCDLIIVARNKDNLEKLKNEINTNVQIIELDLSNPQNSYKLYEQVKNENVDILINNAGYGKFGEFIKSSIEEDINMINLNVINAQILTKLFLKDFVKNDTGYILNVASSAGFMTGGPLMSTYYSTKAYLLRLSEALFEELRRKKSNVKISVLCPGPVSTNFNQRAGVKFSINSITSNKVAKDAIKGLKSGKLLIIPGITMKSTKFLTRFLSDKALLKLTYNIQHRKKG